MSSGVIPNDDCKPAFDKVRLGKVKYVTYKIDDNAEKTEVCAIGETKVWCYYSIGFVFVAAARRWSLFFFVLASRDHPFSNLTPNVSLLYSFHNFCRERVQAEFKFEKFLSLLPETQSRYAVLDWDVTTDDGRQFSKLFFISWVPDSCKAKEKMLYASSKQSLRNALSGVHLDHQAADMDDVTEEIFTLKALGK